MASGIAKTPAGTLPGLPDAILRTLLDPGVALWNLYDQISQARPAAAAHVHAWPSGHPSAPHEHGAGDVSGHAENEIRVQFHNLPPGAQVSTRASGATLHVDGARARTSSMQPGAVETAAHYFDAPEQEEAFPADPGSNFYDDVGATALENLNLAGPAAVDPPPQAAQQPTLNTIVHRIKGSAEVHGMMPGPRERALDDQMTALGATKNPDGSYTLDNDTITLDDRYVVDIPKITKDKGSEFDPSTAHYSRSLEEQTAFLANNRDKHYQEVGADSKLNSHKTTLFAGSIDPGYTDGTVSIDYKDDTGQTRTYALPLERNLEEHLRHEIGHAVYGDAAEIDADTRALKKMNLVGAPAAGHGDGGAPPPPPSPSTHASSSGTSGTAQAAGDATSSFQTVSLKGIPLQFRVMQPSETGASDTGNLDEVTGSVGMLPDYVLSNLAHHGVKWIVVPDSADQGHPDENLTDEKPEGWNPPGTPQDAMRDWGDADSQYHNRDNTVVVGTPDDFHDGDSSINVSLHETGHAFDYQNGYPSHQTSFTDAYDQDKPGMTPDSHATAANPSDAYFLQGGDRGHEETYAESFARYYSGDPTLQTDWPKIYKYWQDHDAAMKAHWHPPSGH